MSNPPLVRHQFMYTYDRVMRRAKVVAELVQCDVHVHRSRDLTAVVDV